MCLPCTPCSFWRPLILSSACYTGYTDPKLHCPFWILWLGLCSDMPLLISVRQTLSSYGKESVSSLNSFIKHGLLCYWCCFVTIFVSPFSKIAAPYLRSLSKACICHKAITKIARLYQKCFCQTGNFFLWSTLIIISLWPSLLTLILVYNFKDCKALVCFYHIASLLLCVVFLKWWGNLSSGIIVSFL